MIKKRAQVTAFVLIGLIILGFILFFSSSQEKAQEPITSLDPGPVAVKKAVQSCLDVTTDQALTLLQDGSVNDSVFHVIPVYYSFGEVNLPELEYYEKDVEWYIDSFMLECLEMNKKDLGLNNYELKYGTPKSEVTFSEDSTLVELNLPVTVFFESKEYSYNFHKTEKNVKFLPILNLTKQILEKTKEDPEYVDFTFLFSQRQNISLYPYPESETVIYSIIDKNSDINSKPFRYTFAVYLGGEA